MRTLLNTLTLLDTMLVDTIVMIDCTLDLRVLR